MNLALRHAVFTAQSFLTLVRARPYLPNLSGSKPCARSALATLVLSRAVNLNILLIFALGRLPQMPGINAPWVVANDRCVSDDHARRYGSPEM